MNREAAVPIDERLEADIRTQQDLVLRRWPDGSQHLFPRTTSNPTGQRSFAASTYRAMLHRWLSMRYPRRTRPACPPHPAPMAAYLRLQADQP